MIRDQQLERKYRDSLKVVILDCLQKGMNQRQISDFTKVNEARISRLLKSLKIEAQGRHQNYVDLELPFAHQTALARVRALITELYTIKEKTTDPIEKAKLIEQLSQLTLTECNLLADVNAISSALRTVARIKRQYSTT